MSTTIPEMNDPAVRRALVLGNGLSAIIAAGTLADAGISVTFARLGDISQNRFADPNEEMLPARFSDLQGVDVLEIVKVPEVHKTLDGIKVAFEDGRELLFDGLFLAPGISLKQKPAGLPEAVELLSFGAAVQTGGNLAFILDYDEPSDPASATYALKCAAKNSREGGRSVVCFRHIPVMHLFGEELYDSVKDDGVEFVRFGDQIPTVLPSEGANRLRLTARDVIDMDNEFVFEADRAFSVTGPDPSSIAPWAVKLAGGNTDEKGLLLSDSVHCHSGCSFSTGIYLIGEATGELDPLNCAAQVKAAVAKSAAFTPGGKSISVSSACARCLTCLRVCPHSAIIMNGKNTKIEPLSLFCQECGICASVCPNRAIEMEALPEETIVKAVNALEQPKLSQTILLLGCKRSAARLAENVKVPANVHPVTVPCAGSISEYSLWYVLARGAAGIIVAGCHKGNCASQTGSEWAGARVERVRKTGVFSSDEPRIKFVSVSANEPARFEKILKEFASDINGINK